MTYFVYRNTDDGHCVVAQFNNQDQAIGRMEYLALRTIDPRVTGYAVRDYDCKIVVEYEV